MIKCCCDKCGKEVSAVHIHSFIEHESAYDGMGNEMIRFPTTRRDLCNECNDKFERLNCDIVNFIRYTDKEIDLLLNTFNVGDQVITADGRDGVITEVCTCDKCRERGFYEPTIKFKDGETDYIMISDKNNGFKSYYSIGNRVFGNLNEESVNKAIDEVCARHRILIGQIGLIKYLKKEREKSNGN